jgi:ring-1,2-phenylacetyl-CoA epoxidase subunit PaaE
MDIITFRIEKIRLETPESFTFFLQEVTGKTVRYKAGQFLTLLLNINGREIRRSYSLSSAPSVDKNLFITVKRISNGEVSRYLTDYLKEGDLIRTLQPAGRFVINNFNEEVFCFVVAGSGINPVYSLIKHLLNNTLRQKILLIYQNRNEQSSIFRKQLLLLQEGYRNRFNIIELFSQPADHNLAPKRLNNSLLEHLVKKYIHTASVQFYLCGPALFMKMGEFTLKTMGYEPTRIFKENFVIDTPPPPAFMIDAEPKNVTIYLRHNQYQLQVKYPQSILQAALQHHVHLPYSCRGGRCSTCTVRLLAGKIRMSINDVLTEKDIEAGLALTCVGYAETDVVVQVE